MYGGRTSSVYLRCFRGRARSIWTGGLRVGLVRSMGCAEVPLIRAIISLAERRFERDFERFGIEIRAFVPGVIKLCSPLSRALSCPVIGLWSTFCEFLIFLIRF